MRELDPAGTFADGPAAGVGDFVSAELAIGGFVWFAQRSYADLYEGFSGFGFVIPECLELFDGAGDGVVDLRVVAIKPFTEVGMPVGFEAGGLCRTSRSALLPDSSPFRWASGR